MESEKFERRVLIVEEALRSTSGHWYEYNRAIVRELRARNIEVTLLAHQDIESSICKELSAVPFFPVTVWDQGYKNPSVLKRLKNIILHNVEIAKLLSQHFKKQDRPYDLVLVPTLILSHWWAWRWLLAIQRGRWFKKVVLTTRNNAGIYVPEKSAYEYTRLSKILGITLRCFRGPVMRGIAELATDSARLAKQYEQLSGIPFSVYPHPREVNLEATRVSKMNQPEIVFTAIGPPRFEKGSDLIIDAFSALLEEESDFRFKLVFQSTATIFRLNGEECSMPFEWTSESRVEIINHDLSSEAYLDRIEQSDVILLPYRRSQYHARLSGIAIEAFQAGVPCICISDTWVSDCMNQMGCGIAISNEAVGDLKAAVTNILENGVPSFKVEKIREAIAFHSPKNFVDQLMARPMD